MNKGPTPLYIASQEGYKSLVAKLLKHKASLDKRSHGITPLFIACQEKHVSVVRTLLKNKADPNKRNKVYAIADFFHMIFRLHLHTIVFSSFRVVGYRWLLRVGSLMCQLCVFFSKNQ